MAEIHETKTTESRWQIWRQQTIALIIGALALLLSCGCGWLIGVTG